MESFSQRESVLLGYSVPSSSKSQYGNSDVDFTDVFGGPPRRSSLQEVRYTSAETTDSFVSRSGDVYTKLSRNSLCGLNEKPVFGNNNVNRRRYPRNDFFDDIFRGNESLSSSPRKHDRDSLSSTSGSSVLSPAGLMPPKADPWSPSLSAQFSLPAKLKETDLPTFISSAHSHHKNKDGASYSVTSYTHSPLSRSASRTNQVRNELTNDVSPQRTLSKAAFSSEESSNSSKPEETDRSKNLERDSDSSEAPTNGNQSHFFIYKWASKGIPFVMPHRGANKSRLNEECKLQRCSSANGRIACKDIARELRSATLHDIDVPSSSSRKELNKPDNCFLFDKNIQDKVEPCQTVEDTIFPISELDTTSTHQVNVEDGPGPPGYSGLEASIEIGHHYAPEMDLSDKTTEQIFVATHEARKTELKSPRSLLSENDDEQCTDEMARKNGLKESNVKRNKKSSAVFDASEIVKDQDEKRTTANSVEMDKADFHFSPSKSRDSLGMNRVRGKVKEFVKIFNQEGSEKPNFDVNDSQHQSSRRKERSKFKNEDTISEKTHSRNVNSKNMPDGSILVDECLKQSEKQHPDTKANSLKSTLVSSGRKDSSVSTADIPDCSELTIGDTDMSFLLITELAQDEERGPQTSDNHGEIQVIDDKIHKWSKGKEGNIRSLLSTMQYVLWSGSGWKPVPLVDIIEGNAVKRTYQKALLCLHPDKLQQKGATLHQKYTAEKVFDILQEAWTHFNTLGAV